MIHLLLGPPLDWSNSRIACGASAAQHVTWDRTMITCPDCHSARPPCTCGPDTTPCPTCRAWSRTHRSDGSRTLTEARRMTEKQWQEDVRKMARASGYLCYHQYSSMKSPAGFPDLVLAKAGAGDHGGAGPVL